MELKSLMTDFLGKTLGKSDAEIADILFKKSDDGTLTDEISETALQSLETAHAEHLASLRDESGKDQYNEGHQKGKFEALSKEEEWLKKAYGLEGKGKLRDLIGEAVQKATAITEDKVQTHPLFVNAKNAWDEEKAALLEAHQQQLTEATTKVERQMRFNQVAPTIDEALIKAGVSADFLKPATKRAFMAQFEGKDFEVTETGTYIKGPDGKLEKDAHGHPVKLEAYISKTAVDWFPIEKQPPRQTPGNDDPPGNPEPSTKWTKENLPKSMEDYEKAYYSIKDPKERSEFASAYEASLNG